MEPRVNIAVLKRLVHPEKSLLSKSPNNEKIIKIRFSEREKKTLNFETTLICSTWTEVVSTMTERKRLKCWFVFLKLPFSIVSKEKRLMHAREKKSCFFFLLQENNWGESIQKKKKRGRLGISFFSFVSIFTVLTCFWHKVLRQAKLWQRKKYFPKRLFLFLKWAPKPRQTIPPCFSFGNLPFLWNRWK